VAILWRNVTPETLKKHQATVKWLTPLLIAHIADQLHEQAMTEEIHKKNSYDVIKWVERKFLDQGFNRRYNVFSRWLDISRDQYKWLDKFTTAYLQALAEVNKLPQYKVTNEAACVHFLQLVKCNFETWTISKRMA